MPKSLKQQKLDKQVELVKTYTVLGGNLALAARTVGISIATAHRWKNQDFWTKIEQELVQQESITLSPKLKRIVEKSLELVQDRLENGDFYYEQKSGTVQRKPVSVRDAHTVMKDTLTIKNDMDRAPAAAAATQNIQETLAQLAKNFEELAAKTKAKPAVNVTDVVFLDEPK